MGMLRGTWVSLLLFNDVFICIVKIIMILYILIMYLYLNDIFKLVIICLVVNNHYFCHNYLKFTIEIFNHNVRW